MPADAQLPAGKWKPGVNYDPLVLPVGVQGSDDPILAARSAVYAVSFNRREHDIASGKADAATGKVAVQEGTP